MFGVKNSETSTLGVTHHLNKPCEEIAGIPRTGCRLRMVLNGIGGVLKRFQTFNRLIVKIPVGHSDVFRKTVLIHRESMIMACGPHLAGLVNLFWTDPSMVSAFGFLGFCVQSQSPNLKPEADAGNRK